MTLSWDSLLKHPGGSETEPTFCWFYVAVQDITRAKHMVFAKCFILYHRSPMLFCFFPAFCNGSFLHFIQEQTHFFPGFIEFLMFWDVGARRFLCVSLSMFSSEREKFQFQSGVNCLCPMHTLVHLLFSARVVFHPHCTVSFKTWAFFSTNMCQYPIAIARTGNA